MKINDKNDINRYDENDIEDFDEFEDYFGFEEKDDTSELEFNEK